MWHCFIMTVKKARLNNFGVKELKGLAHNPFITPLKYIRMQIRMFCTLTVSDQKHLVNSELRF